VLVVVEVDRKLLLLEELLLAVAEREVVTVLELLEL
jgi:hypothetical protein